MFCYSGLNKLEHSSIILQLQYYHLNDKSEETGVQRSEVIFLGSHKIKSGLSPPLPTTAFFSEHAHTCLSHSCSTHSHIQVCVHTHRLPWRPSGKEFAARAGDAGSIPELGRPPVKGNGELQYSCLRNPTDRGGW